MAGAREHNNMMQKLKIKLKSFLCRGEHVRRGVDARGAKKLRTARYTHTRGTTTVTTIIKLFEALKS